MTRWLQLIIIGLWVTGISLFSLVAHSEPVPPPAAAASPSNAEVIEALRGLADKLNATRDDRTEAALRASQETNQKVVEALLKVSEERASQGYTAFTIFMYVLAIIGTIMTLVGFALYKTLSDGLSRDLSKSYNDEIKLALRQAHSTSFRDFSYSWFLHYYRDLQDLLGGKAGFFDSTGTPTAQLRLLEANVCNGLDQARNGLKHLFDETVQRRLEREDQDEWWSVWVSLQNHELFHSTARLLIKRLSGDLDADEIRLLMDDANRLYQSTLTDRRFLREKTRSEWWEQQQTAAFAMFTLGDPDHKEAGRKILADLLQGSKPTRQYRLIPDTWRKDIAAEFAAMKISLAPADMAPTQHTSTVDA